MRRCQAWQPGQRGVRTRCKRANAQTTFGVAAIIEAMALAHDNPKLGALPSRFMALSHEC